MTTKPELPALPELTYSMLLKHLGGAVVKTVWKDGIDIEEPNHEIKALCEEYARISIEACASAAASPILPLTCPRSRRSDCALFDTSADHPSTKLLTPDMLAAEAEAGGVLAAGALVGSPAASEGTGSSSDLIETVEFCIDSVRKFGGDTKTLDDLSRQMLPLLRNRAAVGSPVGAAGMVSSKDVQQAQIIAEKAQQFSEDRTHLARGIYINDLVWALKTLAAHLIFKEPSWPHIAKNP